MGTYMLVAFLFLFGVLNLISTEVPKWVLGLVAVAAALAILFSGGWRKTPMILFALLAWSTVGMAADTNAVPVTPGATPTLQPLLDLLGGHGNWLITLVAWFGTLGAVLAPFSVWLQHKFADWMNTAAASSEVDDDAWLRALYGHPVYRFFVTLLRFVGVRLPTIADLERAIKLQREAVADALRAVTAKP